jgi:hypothetical protein
VAWISRIAASPRLTIATRLNTGGASLALTAKGDARGPSVAFAPLFCSVTSRQTNAGRDGFRSRLFV